MNTQISTTSVQQMSTKEIAVLTGKLLGDIHRDVKRMIIELSDDGIIHHEQYQEVKDNRNYTKEFLLDKELTTILISGYSISIRAKIVRRLNELETAPAKAILPYHMRRYLANVSNVPRGYFSDLTLFASVI